MADDDQGVGELVDGDGGHAQADDQGNLCWVDPQDEMLAGGDGGEEGGQPGQGQQDLGGDRGGAEQVPGAVLVGGGHQMSGAGPPHVQPGAADLHAAVRRRGRVAGQESLLSQLRGERRKSGVIAAETACVQLAAEPRLSLGQLEQLAGAVIDQHPVRAAAAAGLGMGLHPRTQQPRRRRTGRDCSCSHGHRHRNALPVRDAGRDRVPRARPRQITDCPERAESGYGWLIPNVRRDGVNRPNVRRDGWVRPKVRRDGSFRPKVRREGRVRPSVRRDGRFRPRARRSRPAGLLAARSSSGWAAGRTGVIMIGLGAGELLNMGVLLSAGIGRRCFRLQETGCPARLGAGQGPDCPSLPVVPG